MTAEHGSSHIPAEYKNLGLSERQIEFSEGDVYDIGSRELMEYIAGKLNSSYLWCDISRTVVDHNRILHADTASDNTFHSSALKTHMWVEENGAEELTEIPGNLVEDRAGEEARRYVKYVGPYQLKGLEMAYDLKMLHQPVYLIQVHSFHPVYNQQRRSVDIDVLDGVGSVGSTKIARELVADLSHQSEYVVELNKPWGMGAVSGGVFASVLKDRGMRLLAFDVNNKHLRDEEGVARIGDLLVAAIHNVILK